MKTQTKKQQKQCPFCDYRSAFIPGLINHVKGNHKEQWRGSWADTLLAASKKPDEPDIVSVATPKRVTKTEKAELEKKRKYNAIVRARYLAKGLTTTGKTRKRPLRKDTIKKYNLNGKAIVPAQEVQQVDITGDAARAILIAAEVIKNVTDSIKIRGMRR